MTQEAKGRRPLTHRAQSKWKSNSHERAEGERPLLPRNPVWAKDTDKDKTMKKDKDGDKDKSHTSAGHGTECQ